MSSTNPRAYVAPANRRPQSSGKKLKGHEMVLNAIAHDGREITLKLLHEDAEVRGKLIATDAYTLSVEMAHGEVEVFFKHAIKSFTARKRVTVPKVFDAVATAALTSDQ